MADCPSVETLRADPKSPEVREHVASCEKCAAVVAASRPLPKLPFSPPAAPRLEFKEEDPPESAAVTIRPTGEDDR